jgi:Fe-S oxidoreductase/nitrate reductase gamma subunit
VAGYIIRRSILLSALVLILACNSWGYSQDECLECHGTGGSSRLLIDTGLYVSSVHAKEGISCPDCHTAITGDEHFTAEVPGKVDCGSCHEGQAKRSGILSSLMSFHIISHPKQDPALAADKSMCVGCHQGQAAHGEKAAVNKQNCYECHSPLDKNSILFGYMHLHGNNLDLVLILLSVVLLIYGLAGRCKMWKQGRPQPLFPVQFSKGFSNILSAVFRPKRFKDYSYKNIAHLFVFCGFLIPFIIMIAAQFRPVLPGWAGSAVSFLLDIIGTCAIIGTVMLLSGRPANEAVSRGRPIHLWMLLAIFISGFMAEGFRLAIARDSVAGVNVLFTPLGVVFSLALPVSSDLLLMVVRLHFFLVLAFIAYLPYSNMRHVWASLFSLYYHDERPERVIAAIDLHNDPLGAGAIYDLTQKQLIDTDACMNCGRCNISCPANFSGKPLMPQGVVRTIGLKMEDCFSRKDGDANILNKDGLAGKEDIWSCTTCLACVKSCPVNVRQLSDIINLRQHSVLVESRFPSEFKQLFKNIEIFGDAYGAGSYTREDWAMGLNPARVYQDGNVEYLFWAGCTGALYDDSSKAKTAETVNVLKKSGVSFGILGKMEVCCGDAARRLGNEYLFQRMALQNIKTMKDCGVKKIITSCPHCFNVFKNEYPQFGGDFDVIHITEFLQGLVKEGRLKIRSKSRDSITYHDPCYLGRYNNIIRQPRELLEMFMDSEIREMKAWGDNSFCCGAGGGNFWCGKTTGRRMEEIRVEHAIETGAGTMVTSCPFCEILFDSAVRQKGVENSFKVIDVVQLVNQLTE